MTYNLYNSLILTGIIFGLIQIIVLISKYCKGLKQVRFLIFTIFCLTASNLQYWLIDIGLDIIPDILYIQFELLILPGFYLFIMEYLSKELKHSRRIFFLPFLIGMVFQVIQNTIMIKKNQLYIFHIAIESISILYNLGLILACFIVLSRYNEKRPQQRLNFLLNGCYGPYF